MTQPTIGRIVHYAMSETDAGAVNGKRRDGFVSEAHGNSVTAGQVYPAMIVRNFGGPNVNLQVFLDGNDSYWATSRAEGDQPGTWAWPARV